MYRHVKEACDSQCEGANRRRLKTSLKTSALTSAVECGDAKKSRIEERSQTRGRVANRRDRKASPEGTSEARGSHAVDRDCKQAPMDANSKARQGSPSWTGAVQKQPPSQGSVASSLLDTKDYQPAEENSDEDLYRGADEIEEERKEKGKPQHGIQYLVPRPGDGASVEAPVDLLSYSRKEWRGNTSKSTLIRKGYMAVSQQYRSLRRVRGDNYCALRATLFQILSQSHQLPPRFHNMDITSSLQAEKDLIGEWKFPFTNKEHSTSSDAMAQLQVYLELLRDRWQAAVRAGSAAERENLCRQVFQGQEEEYSLLEALKFFMLQTAVELHGLMGAGAAGIPEFCSLLFARDSSSCPRTLFRNHLRHVGFTGGLEQVEMFLLGYALKHTIKVYRLYKSDTEEFITHYPDDHSEDWPCIFLLTEDDRHYNVPVA